MTNKLIKKILPPLGTVILLWLILNLIIIIRDQHSIHQRWAKRVPGLSHLIKEKERSDARAKMQMLNLHVPQFGALVAAITDGAGPLRDAETYIPYYEKITDYFPGLADGWAMLGYCHAGLGRPAEALDSYRRAAEVDRDFFWHWYNLGVLSYQQERYAEAAQALYTALKTSPQITLDKLLSSQVYRQIMGQPGFSYRVDVSLKQGFAQALYVLGRSLNTLQKEDDGSEALRQARVMVPGFDPASVPVTLKVF